MKNRVVAIKKKKPRKSQLPESKCVWGKKMGTGVLKITKVLTVEVSDRKMEFGMDKREKKTPVKTC